MCHDDTLLWQKCSQPKGRLDKYDGSPLDYQTMMGSVQRLLTRSTPEVAQFPGAISEGDGLHLRKESGDAKWFANCPPNRMHSHQTIFTQPQFNAHGVLTPREQEVIVGVANGMTTKQIATSLGISFKTAECHRLRLMQKLQVHSTAEVVRYAVRCGLIEA